MISKVKFLLGEYVNKSSKLSLTDHIRAKSNLDQLLELLIPYSDTILALPDDTPLEDIHEDYRATVEQVLTEPYETDVVNDDYKKYPTLNKDTYRIENIYLPVIDYKQDFILVSLKAVYELAHPQIHAFQVYLLHDEEGEVLGSSLLYGIDLKNKQLTLKNIKLDQPAYLLEQVKYVKLKQWWHKRESYSMWVNTLCLTESEGITSQVYAKLEDLTRLYSIDWELFYTPVSEGNILLNEEDPFLVARGVDGVYPGCVYISAVGSLFLPGAYEIKAKMKYTASYNIKTYRVAWNIEQTTDKLVHE